MTGDIQPSTDFHNTLVKSFGSVSIAAAFIRIPYQRLLMAKENADGLQLRKTFFTNYKPMYSNQQSNESEDS